jgi:hypothetical protein
MTVEKEQKKKGQKINKKKTLRNKPKKERKKKGKSRSSPETNKNDGLQDKQGPAFSYHL